jgi:hypothetical protein
MTGHFLDALRYKSEGTDLDFKSDQYLFVGATDEKKSEMLKDILAIANAWRDGTGYILVGFKEQKPPPALVVGITSSLDDASLQQFVNAKLNPKLKFHYEEISYEGKTVGVFTIPKQKRAFALAQPYGKLKSNVVYVRRGSSTDEATPGEVMEMGVADAGQREIRLNLSIRTKEGDELADRVARSFLAVPEALPDYSSPRPPGPFGLHLTVADPMGRDNEDFWRELAEYARVHSALIEVRFFLRNASECQLTHAKLEVSIEPMAGQVVDIIAGEDLPEMPRRRFHIARLPTLHNVLARNAERFVIDDNGSPSVCNVRFGTLLPGEEGTSSDTLALVPRGPGQFRLRMRVLAAELTAPREIERIVDVTGDIQPLEIERLRASVQEGDSAGADTDD